MVFARSIKSRRKPLVVAAGAGHYGNSMQGKRGVEMGSRPCKRDIIRNLDVESPVVKMASDFPSIFFPS
jgi:hypothetical protein